MPTFSEIRIEFLVDYQDDYTLTLVTQLNGTTNTTEIFTWVASRTNPFEVTTGTPTGIAGETTAINYAAAYLLDNPTGYVVTVENDNQVLIQSETQFENFIGFRSTDGDDILLTKGVDYDVVFSNDEQVVDISNVEFILTRSPHYINTPFNFETTQSATIDLYIWNGDLASVPATPTYTLTKVRPSVDYAEFNTDISRIVNEKLDGKPNLDIALPTQIVDSGNEEVKWIKWVMSYTDPTEVIPDIEGFLIATEGYGYYLEGVNPTKPDDNILTSTDYRKVSRDGFIVLPYVNNGEVTSITIQSENNQINATETPTATDNSNKAVQYLYVDVSQATTDEYITVTFLPDGDFVTYEITDECRYEPKQVVFKNKYGMYDSLTLFKKSNTSINVKNDDFTNAYISSGTYSTTAHQIQKINIQGTETITVNSGYIKESENSIYQEMMLSDAVYFYENDAFVPVNVKTSSLEFKTRVNDSLVNYTVEFEYAYNLIQNV
mgnify:CR=1 FL=1